jgi:hypothetical protein
MHLAYDERDLGYARKRGSRHLDWLIELGAAPLSSIAKEDECFLFAGARSIEDYRDLTAGRLRLRDTAGEREPLLRLDSVLARLAHAGVDVPTARTWRIEIDSPVPSDLQFPLFVRTAATSWKLGGTISKVKNMKELEAEASALRRAIQWDATILARQWLDLAIAGRSVYGPVPREVRVWVVDDKAHAWSFHHLNIVKNPEGFPPSPDDLAQFRTLAESVAFAFRSRLVAADFAQRTTGQWTFIEAGPGSCAGCGHEAVFKSVARQLSGRASVDVLDETGNPCCCGGAGGLYTAR